MMSFKIVILYLVCLFFTGEMFCQEIMTLQQCVDRGLKASPEYRLKQLDIISAEIVHRKPIMEYLPSISFTGNHTYNIGSVIDPATNNRVSSKILSDNFGLNANITLLDLNTFTIARRNKIAVLKANADMESIAAEYTQTIIDQYVTVIYAQELIKIQKKQFENAIFNLDRVSKEVSLGKRPNSDLYDMQWSYTQEENSILQSKQQLYNEKLTLLHLINVSGTEPDLVEFKNIDVVSIDEIIDVEKIFENAVQNSPSLRSATYFEDISKKEMNVQRNLSTPTISAFYSYSSFYYQPLNQSGNSMVNPFWTQVNDNKNHYIGFQLNIPIFNGFKNSNKVQQYKVNYEKSKVSYEQQKLKLRQTIEKENARRQQGLELSSKMQLSKVLAEKSFSTTQSKFTSDLIDVITFSSAKNQLLMAEYNLLKAKISTIHALVKLQFIQEYKL